MQAIRICRGRKQLGKFLERTFESETWNEVVIRIPNSIQNEAADFTCEYVPETKSFSFMVGVFAPEGTAVPKGLDYRDVAPTLVWIWKKEAGKDALTELNKSSDEDYVSNFDAPGFPWRGFLRADTYSILPVRKAKP